MTLPNDDYKQGVNEPWRTVEPSSTAKKLADYAPTQWHNLPDLGQTIQADFIALQNSLMAGIHVHPAMTPGDWVEMSQLDTDIDGVVAIYHACQSLERFLTSGFLAPIDGHEKGQSNGSPSVSTPQRHPIADRFPAYSTGVRNVLPLPDTTAPLSNETPASTSTEPFGDEVRNTYIRSDTSNNSIVTEGQGDRPSHTLYPQNQASLDTSIVPQAVASQTASSVENPSPSSVSDSLSNTPQHGASDARNPSPRVMALPRPYTTDGFDMPPRSQPILADSDHEQVIQQDRWSKEALHSIPHITKADSGQAVRPVPLVNPNTEADNHSIPDSLQPDTPNSDVPEQNSTCLSPNSPLRSTEQASPNFDSYKPNPSRAQSNAVQSDGRSHPPSPVKGLRELAQWLDTEQPSVQSTANASRADASPQSLPLPTPLVELPLESASIPADKDDLSQSDAMQRRWHESDAVNVISEVSKKQHKRFSENADQSRLIPLPSQEDPAPSHELLSLVQKQQQHHQFSDTADTQHERHTEQLGAIAPRPSHQPEPNLVHRPSLEKLSLERIIHNLSYSEPNSAFMNPDPTLPDTEEILEALADPLYERIVQEISNEYRQFYGE